MSAIGKGDWVECVDGSPHKNPKVHEAVVVKGALYQVSKVIPAGTYPTATYQEDCLRFVNDPTPEPFAWRTVRFRPIYRPRADLIESLLAPLPEHVLEQA